LHTNPTIQKIIYLNQAGLNVDLLRLDQIHPIVSGNKWYKLRFYIQAALAQNANTIASFGGPYSNHLVALAFTAKENNLASIGYVRANEGEPITPTLQEAQQYGMQLVFLGRSLFQSKKEALLLNANAVNNSKLYFVDEGGYGQIGAKGAATIITDWEMQNSKENPILNYDYIIAAVGTGTMLAGIINACNASQTIIGIPVLKNEGTIKTEISSLLIDPEKHFQLLHQFHQGGYAKTTPMQIDYMNFLWAMEHIPTDIVYTGKLLYAVDQLVKENYFKVASKILVIHSGGLQGNRSLANGVLQFNG
jgi:1-aminocyclopropane-1-carboxylate deaminase